MATALSLIYNGVSLHTLGTVTIVSQQSQFTPDELPQRETRTLTVRIETWSASAPGYTYDTLYTNIQSLRAALRQQNKVLKWTSPGSGGAGTIQLNRPATVLTHNLPEDPNANGVFSQMIEIVFRYDFDRASISTLLTATVDRPGGTSHISLGQVHAWKDDFKNAFYSEWRNIRQRSSGTVTCSGEIFKDTGTETTSTDTRMTSAVADLIALKAELQAGRYVTLTYGPAGNLFNQTCKIENFSADINQGPYVGSIKWNMTVSYTVFPDEDAYAGADYTSTLSEDREGSRTTLSLSGRVLAATEALAVAKLATLTNVIVISYGFTGADQTKNDVTKSWVTSDDTQGEGDDSTNDEQPVVQHAFFELTFSRTYEKKSVNVTAYALTISDVDDIPTGLLTRTYSGWVVANGVSEAAAYTAALAQARTLGANKHDFKVSTTETRSDRKTTQQSGLEFLRLEFSYVYRIKGSTTYLEMSTSTDSQTFGENTIRVSGYVVAVDAATANTQYLAQVKALYTGSLIRSETVDVQQVEIQKQDASFGTLPMRLDFSFLVFSPKSAGTYTAKYRIQTSMDYVNLSQTTTVEGLFSADATYLAAVEANGANPLLTFLAGFVATYGAMTTYERGTEKEITQSTDNAAGIPSGVRFSATFNKAMSTAAQVLRCQLEEDITYSGTRWREQATPVGASLFQDCGTTPAVRTVNGSITAATEAAARAWMNTQHESGLWQEFYGDAPESADRYEEAPQVSTSFAFAPLPTTPTVGTVRSSGTGANFQVCELRFRFTERVPSMTLSFVEGMIP
jgi:hypothetical protein